MLDTYPYYLTQHFGRSVRADGGTFRGFAEATPVAQNRCSVITNWRGLGWPRMAVKLRGSGYPQQILVLLLFCRLSQKRSFQSNHGLLEYHEKLASRARTKSKRRVRVLTMTWVIEWLILTPINSCQFMQDAATRFSRPPVTRNRLQRLVVPWSLPHWLLFHFLGQFLRNSLVHCPLLCLNAFYLSELPFCTYLSYDPARIWPGPYRLCACVWDLCSQLVACVSKSKSVFRSAFPLV